MDSDDSLNDPNCVIPSDEGPSDDSTSDDSTNGTSPKKTKQVKVIKISNPFLSPEKPTPISNPFLSPEKTGDVFEYSDADEVNAKFKNPLMSSTDSDPELDNFSPNANSTTSFQHPGEPFTSDLQCVKPPAKLYSTYKVICEYCAKSFTNKYNMKLHMIRFSS